MYTVVCDMEWRSVSVKYILYFPGVSVHRELQEYAHKSLYSMTSERMPSTAAVRTTVFHHFDYTAFPALVYRRGSAAPAPVDAFTPLAVGGSATSPEALSKRLVKEFIINREKATAVRSFAYQFGPSAISKIFTHLTSYYAYVLEIPIMADALHFEESLRGDTLSDVPSCLFTHPPSADPDP